jgi:protein-disulfide isomerase
MEAFNTCFQANTYKDEIEADLAAGRMKDVSGTPSVFVNGQQLAPDFEQISQAIDAALAASGN